jgi:hypothetical protein
VKRRILGRIRAIARGKIIDYLDFISFFDEQIGNV